MSDHTHRGARAFRLSDQQADRRITDVAESLRILESATGSSVRTAFARDSDRVLQGLQSPAGGGVMSLGMVVHSIPYFNWYRVQTGLASGIGGSVAACMGSASGLTPAGPREIASARPLDFVLLFHPPGLPYAIIVSVLPPGVVDASTITSDWIVQGGGSGLKREDAHQFPQTGTYGVDGVPSGDDTTTPEDVGGGGVMDFSAGRPIDSTAFERGFVTPTGLAFTIDDFLIQMRVNEQCGLWMSLFDSWCRLAGVQLVIESAVHTEEAGDDEGEARLFRGVATYPWEALGLYAPGEGLTVETEAKDVQYTSAQAATDLPPGQADVEPVYRYREHGGYLGQGAVREVVRPARTEGVRRYSDVAPDEDPTGELGPQDVKEPDEGLFREAIGLDGGYTLVSAKSIHIGKRCKIPVARAFHPPEHGEGDDASADNYKFSGLWGDEGESHVVGEVTVPQQYGAARRVAGVMDLITYDLNWKVLHPFHYHAADYLTPQEAQKTAFERNQGELDFSVLATQFWMDDPEPVMLQIDHRYGEVSYYERESFVRLHDDGSVHIGDGYGSEIALAGGRIRMSAPGGIDMTPGTDFAVLAGQIILRAHGSVDVTSAQKDVRLKAEGNMQFLSNGGILMESNGEGLDQAYDQLFGEDVIASGIVLRANNSALSLLGGDVYVRSGGEDLGTGDILLDAGKGTGLIQTNALEVDLHVRDAVSFNFGPTDTDPSVRKVYSFDENDATLDVNLNVRDKITGYGQNSGIIVRGSISATKSIASGGKVADKNGGALGKVPTGFESQINQSVSEIAAAVTDLKTTAAERFRETVTDRYYVEGRIGDDNTLPLVRFGYRDPPGAPVQYGTANFAWPESRWQMYSRFGLGTGGGSWDEPPVTYQGEDTYPWPGRKAWAEDEVFLRAPEPVLFDPETGCGRDRPDPYIDDPTLGDWSGTTMADGFQVQRS